MLGWHRRQRWGAWDGPRDPAGPGVVVSDQALTRVTEIDLTSDDAVAQAALDCDDETDFFARLRRG